MQFHEAILYNLFNYTGFWNFPKTSDIVAQYIYESHFRYNSAFEPNYILKKNISTISKNKSEVNSVELKSRYNYYWNNVVICDALSCCAIEGVGDYYPFGMAMPGRTFSSNQYRYGFNGKEKDIEGMGGGGSTYDYGFRIYNPQIAKFLSVDPLSKSYPWYTPYQFAGNMPICAIDLDGLEEKIIINVYEKDNKGNWNYVKSESSVAEEVGALGHGTLSLYVDKDNNIISTPYFSKDALDIAQDLWFGIDSPNIGKAMEFLGGMLKFQGLLMYGWRWWSR